MKDISKSVNNLSLLVKEKKMLSEYRGTQGGKQRVNVATVWLIQVDSLWCVSMKAFSEVQRRGLPKAHQRVAYFISRVENVLRKRGGGNSEEVSESNKAIVPIADPNTHVTVVTAAPNKSPNRRSGTLN